MSSSNTSTQNLINYCNNGHKALSDYKELLMLKGKLPSSPEILIELAETDKDISTILFIKDNKSLLTKYQEQLQQFDSPNNITLNLSTRKLETVSKLCNSEYMVQYSDEHFSVVKNILDSIKMTINPKLNESIKNVKSRFFSPNIASNYKEIEPQRNLSNSI